MHKIIQQTPYYIPLFTIFAVGAVGFFTFSYDHIFQTAIIVAIGVSHVVWGVVYHSIHHDLTAMTILEYMVFSAFGVAAVLSVLQ